MKLNSYKVILPVIGFALIALSSTVNVSPSFMPALGVTISYLAVLGLFAFAAMDSRSSRKYHSTR
jgi:hypothetical protein